MRRNTKAFTILEVMMTTLVGAVMLVSLFKIFSSGMKTSQKGSSHLTNVQAASIILSQIEKDLSLMIYEVSLPEQEPGKFVGRIYKSYGAHGSPGIATVTYQPEPKNLGYRRTLMEEPEPQSHVFARDLNVEVQWEKLSVHPSGRIGYNVTVTVMNPVKKGEKNSLRRFIYCYNLLHNRKIAPHDWKFKSAL